jgi:hypothetical protein
MQDILFSPGVNFFDDWFWIKQPQPLIIYPIEIKFAILAFKVSFSHGAPPKNGEHMHPIGDSVPRWVKN